MTENKTPWIIQCNAYDWAKAAEIVQVAHSDYKFTPGYEDINAMLEIWREFPNADADEVIRRHNGDEEFEEEEAA